MKHGTDGVNFFINSVLPFFINSQRRFQCEQRFTIQKIHVNN